MNKQRLYYYLTLAALTGFWSCSSSLQTARNAGEVDDLYGTSETAVMLASNSSDPSSVVERPSRQSQRSYRNANPDYSYNDEQRGYDANTDEYYTELSARKLNRGLSADPGWGDNNVYNSGFVNGYNAATASAYSWNRWGFNNTGFWNGMGLGMGMGMGFGSFGMSPWGFNRWGMGSFYNPWYSPWGYDAFAYNSFGMSPWSYGYGFNDPFYSPWGYNSFYGGGWGGWNSWNSWGGRPIYGSNVTVIGADPYRRTYNSRYDRSAGRFNDGFANSPRANDPNAGSRRYYSNGSSSGSSRSGNSSDAYYARPRQNGRGGAYYYDNGTASGGRSGSYSNAPAYSSGSSSRGSSSEYYARPRQNGAGGSYNGNNAGSRGSYSQPSYQSQQRTYQPSQPTYQQPSYQSQSRGSYSAPSAPSYSGGGGSSSSGGGGGGGSRGPR